MELEQEIMAGIGFHGHFDWYNGSGDCGNIRREAIRRVKDAIQQSHRAGKEIDGPRDSLISLLPRIEATEKSDYSLTKTWQASSYVIAAHIHAHFESDKQNYYARFERDLREKFLGPSVRRERSSSKSDPNMWPHS